jgi:hypothetical protein
MSDFESSDPEGWASSEPMFREWLSRLRAAWPMGEPTALVVQELREACYLLHCFPPG